MSALHPFEDWQLSAHAGGDLEPAVAAQVAAHLESCLQCRLRQQELARIPSELMQLPDPEPSRDLWPMIASRLDSLDTPDFHPFEDWQISASLDGDLEDAEAAALAAHLEDCRPCRHKAAEFAALRDAISVLPASDPSPFVWARISAELDRKTRRRIPVARWGAALAAAAALAVVFATVSRQQGPHPAASPPLASRSTSVSPAPASVTPKNLAEQIFASLPIGPFSRPGDARTHVKASAGPESVPAAARPGSSTLLASLEPNAPDHSLVPDLGPDPDPALTAAIRAHLEELDSNIFETQKSLALNPGNERVQAAAWQAYMAKVEYLRSIYNSQGVRGAGKGRSSKILQSGSGGASA